MEHPGIAQSGRSTIWWRAARPRFHSVQTPCLDGHRAKINSGPHSLIHGGWNCSSTVVWRYRSESICCSHFNMNDLSVGCDDGEQQKHSNQCVACVRILYAVVFRIWLTIYDILILSTDCLLDVPRGHHSRGFLTKLFLFPLVHIEARLTSWTLSIKIPVIILLAYLLRRGVSFVRS